MSIRGRRVPRIPVLHHRAYAQGLIAAVRANTISIGIVEAGMFAGMAFVYYWLFPSRHLDVTMAVYRFMIQIAMILGLFTAPPANAWLIQMG